MAEAEAAKDKDKDKVGPPPPLPEGWNRCHAFMEKKRRYCRQDQVNEWGYCGNHAHLFSAHFVLENDDTRQQQRRRVPCPIDASHTIFEDQVQKHIKICPKATRLKEQTERPYFNKNINCGGHGSLGQRPSSPPTNGDALEWAKRVARKVLEGHQRLFEGTAKPVERLTLEDVHGVLPMKDLSQPELDAGLAGAVEHYRMRSGGPRHLHQQASLLGHLRSAGVFPPRAASVGTKQQRDSILFLEMGAGRGMLGLAAAGVAAASGVSANVHLTMVERSGGRSKADTVLRKSAVWRNQPREYLQLHTVQWNRVQCDLAHIHVPTILKEDSPSVGEKRKEPTGDGTQLVVVAKHLCGAGTDLALKSLRDINVDVCVMATCCHGVCTWNDYVARDFLMDELGESFGEAEFELLRKWSTGTVAAVKDTTAFDNGAEHQTIQDDSRDPLSVTGISRLMNLKCGVQGLGRACQRLLDAGRCDYMRKVLFPGDSYEVHLCHYVNPEVTPQNAVLVARKKRS